MKSGQHDLISFLQKQEYFCEEEKEIIIYGIEQGKNFILSVAVTMLLGVLFKVPAASAVFIIAFIPLRKYAGGYHANSRLGCARLSIVSISCCFWLISKINWSGFYLLPMGVSYLIIFLVAPVQNSKKILEEIEKKFIKVKPEKFFVLKVFF